MFLATLEVFSEYRIRECATVEEAEYEILTWLLRLRESYPHGRFRGKIYHIVAHQEREYECEKLKDVFASVSGAARIA